MIEYPLNNCLVEAGSPVEVGRSDGHFWFSSLHRVGDQTLCCGIIRSADVAQGKWPADLFRSDDGGATWRWALSIDSYGHASVRRDGTSTLMMPYELWPQAPPDRQSCRADGTLLTLTAEGTLAAEAVDVRFLDIPAPLADYHVDELDLKHNGNILELPEGILFTTLYGTFEGDERNSCLAAASDDGGLSWTYRGTVAGSEDFASAREGPNESSTVVLDNGDLLCIYRVSGGDTDYHKSYSHDQGRTWSDLAPMEGMRSVQPRLARLGNGALVLTGGRPGLFLWISIDGKGEVWERVNLGEHHNRMTVDKSLRFSEAFCGAEVGEDPAMSTAYTGIMPWGADGAIVTYDRLANGWAGAPGPNGAVDRVFGVRVAVTASGY